MNNVLLFILIFIAIILISIVISLSKNVSNPYNNIMFGVTVPSEKINSNEIYQIKQYYKKNVNTWTILVIIFFLPELLINSLVSGYPSVCFIYFFLWISIAILSYSKVIIGANKKLNSVKKNKWQAEEGLISSDNDDKWLYGFFYCNPMDKAAFVEKRIGVGYTVNLANMKGKIFFYGMSGFGIVIVIMLSLLLLSSDFYNPNIKISNNNIAISDLIYSMNFEIKDIKEIELLDNIPSIIKISGSETKAFARGNFYISNYGKTKAYIFKENPKCIIVKLRNSYVIYNEKTDEETLSIYNLLKESMNAYK